MTYELDISSYDDIIELRDDLTKFIELHATFINPTPIEAFSTGTDGYGIKYIFSFRS